jgi:hypothetical protein
MLRRFIFLGVLIACSVAAMALAENNTKDVRIASIDRSIPVNIGPPIEPPAIAEPLPEAPTRNPQLENLAAYFETAMNKWAKPDKLSADYHSIATDVATVVLAEDPIWTTDTTRARTGIELLGIANFESTYRTFVDDGTCNRYAKDPHAPKEIAALLKKFGNCDGGWAHSMWQVHPLKWNDGHGHIEEFSGEALSDRKTAIRAALILARRSIRGSGGLCWYTGEGTDGNGCPKAVVRFNFGIDYFRKHPYTAG